jgi:hypothetical protein
MSEPSRPYVAPKMMREHLDTLFAPDRVFSKQDAFGNLYRRADFATGEVPATAAELAQAWGWTESKVDRFLAALDEAGYLLIERRGKSPRAGRRVVVVEIALRRNGRRNNRGRRDGITPLQDNDLRGGVTGSVTEKRGNGCGTIKEVEEELNSPPTGERGAREARGSLALVVHGVGTAQVDGLTAEQRETALAMHRKWIEHYTARAGAAPSGPTVAKQCAIAKQLAGKYTREQLGRAFVGMDAYWKFKNGEAWTLLQLARDFDEVYGQAMQNKQIKQAMAEAEFDNLTRGAA